MSDDHSTGHGQTPYATWYICYNAAEEEVWRGFNADVGRTPGWSTVTVEGQPYSPFLTLKELLFDKACLYPGSKITFDYMGSPALSIQPARPEMVAAAADGYSYNDIPAGASGSITAAPTPIKRSGPSLADADWRDRQPPVDDAHVAPGCSLFSDPAKNKPLFANEANLPQTGSKEWRKQRPLFSGVFNYFPDALMEVAYVSYVGNQQHNPGQPLHWSRGKSDDHMDCELRHLLERGTKDSDGTLHSAKRAWRALADLQLEIEASKQETTK